MPARANLDLLGADVRDEVADRPRCRRWRCRPSSACPPSPRAGARTGRRRGSAGRCPCARRIRMSSGRAEDAQHERDAECRRAARSRAPPPASGRRAPQRGGHQLEADRPAALHQHRVAGVRRSRWRRRARRRRRRTSVTATPARARRARRAAPSRRRPRRATSTAVAPTSSPERGVLGRAVRHRARASRRAPRCGGPAPRRGPSASSAAAIDDGLAL